MKNEKHLPIYGVGPFYVVAISALTLTAVLMRNMPIFSSGKLSVLRIPALIAGVVFIAGGVFMWIYAVPISKIDDGIKENRLVTTGAYALVKKSDLFCGNACLHRRDPPCRQCVVFHAAACLLVFHDCINEGNRGEMAEESLWRGI